MYCAMYVMHCNCMHCNNDVRNGLTLADFGSASKVMYFNVLRTVYYNVLYCTVLYCTVLYCDVI